MTAREVGRELMDLITVGLLLGRATWLLWAWSVGWDLIFNAIVCISVAGLVIDRARDRWRD